MHEPHFHPWGTVTPDYWSTAAPARPDAQPVTASVARQTAPSAEQPPHAPVTKEAEPVQPNPAAAAATTQNSVPAQTTEATAEAALPQGFQERIASVTAAFNSPENREGLAAAGVEAEKLDQELTEQFGQQHTYTINIRELRGWLAYLAGDPATAARWYLHTTGLQIGLHGPSHEQTQGSVRRAVHTWQQITDPAEVVQIGQDLAKVTAAVLGESSDVARYVQARMNAKQQPQQ
ncbi:hypothetical protein [Streptomyces sp. NPDC048191]|uniref:hypothetical protein n=1 Tax=Streptomyces sp. NPDC048191 TaxID=3155484 RepID=UPI0033C48976